MVLVTIWKKFSKCSLLIALAFFSYVEPASALPSEPAIPVLNNIGIVPVQWQNPDATFRFKKFQERIEQLWPEIAKSAHRFNLIHQEVSAELWSTPDGRKQLVDTYELQGFVTIAVAVKPDVMTFTTRLLSPDLTTTYLHEVETVAKSWATTAIEEHLHERLQGLLFRMINRLPVDTNITSVQGAFVTLDKGLNQNMRIGQELVINRTFVTDTHPATGAWLKFKQSKLGQAKVIEAKSQSAIAQIQSMSYEGAIKVGDGAKIDELPSRIVFKRLDETPAFEYTNESDNPIIYPKPPVTTPKVIMPMPKTQMGQLPKIIPPKVANAEDSPEEQEVEPPEQEEPEDHEEPQFVASKDAPPNLNITGAVRMWSASGPAGIKVSASLPLWLLNSFQVKYGELLDETMGWEALGRLELGDTSNGSYGGFGAGGSFFYRLHLDAPSYLQLGGRLEFYSIGVSSERYGGEDVFKIVPYGKYIDRTYLDFLGSEIEYYGYLDYSPLASGKVGLRKAKQNVSGYSGWHLKVGASMVAPNPDIWWGTELMFGNESYKIDDGTLSLSDLAISLLVGMHI